MEYHLGRAGYDVITARNGREGMELVRSTLPRLILLDIAMPEMGGVSLLRQLKQTAATRDIPIVIVTVHTDAEVQGECKAAGADAFLCKPVNPAQLLEEMQRLWPGVRPTRGPGPPT